MKFYYAVNSALYVCTEDTGILIDGLFRANYGFSAIPESFFQELRQRGGMFSNCKALIFTHRHGDHFDKGYTERVEWCPYCMPNYYGNGLRPMMKDDARWLTIGDLKVLEIPTVHEGEKYRAVPHNSLLLDDGRESVFIPGDALITEKINKFLLEISHAPIIAVFCNPFQIANPQCHRLIQENRISNVVLYHLPFIADDKFFYHEQAKSIIKRYPESLPALICPHFMNWVDMG